MGRKRQSRSNKVPNLNLKAITQTEVQAFARFQTGFVRPLGERVLVEAQPTVSAGFVSPSLVVAAQLGEQQNSAGAQVLGERA